MTSDIAEDSNIRTGEPWSTPASVSVHGADAGAVVTTDELHTSTVELTVDAKEAEHTSALVAKGLAARGTGAAVFTVGGCSRTGVEELTTLAWKQYQFKD